MAERAAVLVTWPRYDPAGAGTGRRLRAAGLEVRLAPKTAGRTPEELARLLDGAIAAIVSTDPFAPSSAPRSGCA
jgi:hypothetical protein